MFHVYMLKNELDDLYIGYTSDLQRRLSEHNSSQSFHTKGHQWEIVYVETYRSALDAKDRERKLKQYGKSLAMLKKRLEHSL
jgi:putative endonuclease